MSLSDSQQNAIQAIETICCIVSMIGCATMGYRTWMSRKSGSMIDNLLLYLLAVDFFLSLNLSVGIAATRNHSYCQFQGFFAEWLGLCSVLWNASMSFQLFKFIVHKKHPDRIKKKLKRHFAGIVICTFIVSIILLGVGSFGNAEIYCWITTEYEALRYFCFYFIVLGCWAFAIVCLTWTSVSVNLYSEDGSLAGAESVIQRKILQYTIVFVVTWFFGFLNRSTEYFAGHVVFTTSLLEAIFIPLQGFLNSACYGGLFDCGSHASGDELLLASTSSSPRGAGSGDSSQCKPRSASGSSTVELNQHTKAAISRLLPELVYVPKTYSVFTTTYNIGEAPIADTSPNLKDWILRDHDIYAIGVQECIDLKGLREHILDHLGGPEAYTMYGVEIGSNRTNLGYHGYIALTCFVRTEDVRAGRVRPVDSASNTMATGTNLIVTTAQNKGAVGLLFQVHDTSIGFVTAHLPSDSKGKSKLSKRNASIDSILKEVILAPEDTGFDLHLQHDHIVLMGDLNYRMDTARTAKEGVGASILTHVAEAGSVQKACLKDDVYWINRKYNLLRAKSDPLFPDQTEIDLLNESLEASRSAWETVLETDELRYIMKYKGVFSGFVEPLPSFPPSYKRKKGTAEGDCGDYTDALDILRGFTNTGEVDVEEVHSSPLFSPNVKKTIANTVPTRRPARLSNGKKSVPMSAVEEEKKGGAAGEDADEEEDEGYQGSSSIRFAAAAVDGPSPKKKGLSFQPAEESSGSAADSTAAVLPKKKGISFDNAEDPDVEKQSTPVDAVIASPKRKGISFDGPGSDKPSTSVDAVAAPASVSASPKRKGISFDGADVIAEDAISVPAAPSSSPKMRATRRQSTLVALAPTNAKETKKFRPPSYTDRILFHSLPDRQERLVVQGYDFCDDMRASDHRPVSMVLNLEANKAFSFEGGSAPSIKANASRRLLQRDASARIMSNLSNASADPSAGAGASTGPAQHSQTVEIQMGDSVELYELIISQIQVNLESSNESEIDAEFPNSVDDASIGTGSSSNPLTIRDLETGDGPGVQKSLSAVSETSSSSKRVGSWRYPSPRQRADSAASSMSDVSSTSTSTSDKKKKAKKEDGSVWEVTVVFPLPAKDPLIVHRKMYDFARAFNVNSSPLISQLRRIVHEAIPVDKRGGVIGVGAGEDAFLKITHKFPWKPAGAEISFDNTFGGIKSQRSSTGVDALTDAFHSVQANDTALTVAGCLAPSLGAHVMLKFTNRGGDGLGECVVSLTNLISRDLDNPLKSEFRTVQLTSGGQNRGKMCAVFSLKVLASTTALLGAKGSTKSSRF